MTTKYWKPKVTVIVPVYRGVEHFPKLLESLQQQTIRDVEMIFIDDKGGDGAFEIAMKAAETDSRIVLLDNGVNRGPGYSRNSAIEVARGEYITFADSDDLVPINAYERMYSAAKEKGAEVVKGARRKFDEVGGEYEMSTLNARIEAGLSTCQTLLALFTYEHQSGIYSRELVMRTGARNCPDAYRDQDTCFLTMLMAYVSPEKFVLLKDEVVYLYRQHDESLIHRKKDAWFLGTASKKSRNDGGEVRQPPRVVVICG